MYYNPIFERKNYQQLNDDWLFSYDSFNWQKITVPFCIQSKMSGINDKNFVSHCYYKKYFKLANKPNSRVLIKFGAVDYRCSLLINNKYVGSHVGGYTPFEFDITDFLNDSINDLTLEVFDDEFNNSCSGKQSSKLNSYGCFYTRTTGIWQDVFLEFVPFERILNFKFYPNIENPSVDIAINVKGEGFFAIDILFDSRLVGHNEAFVKNSKTLTVFLEEKHLWELGKGDLYTVIMKFNDDVVYSYFGLRKIEYKGYEFLLNNKSVFQKLVLDQGYYYDGIYTAKNVEEMERDIDNATALGFNGLRLHQKVFDPRYLYLCDKKGVIVWGEYPSWGIDYSNLNNLGQFISEWQEVLNRDFNHPSIITWCPLNEVWDDVEKGVCRDVRFIDIIYDFTKAFDKTRPVIDVSGGHHGNKTDLYDFHCYEDVDQLKIYLDNFEQNDILNCKLLYSKNDNLRYVKGLPVNLSEFGGMAINVESKVKTVNEGAVFSVDDWGYGESAKNADAFVKKYCELVKTIFSYKKISGFCYTQLYDIEQEQNGFYTYQRQDKLTELQKKEIKKANDYRK